MREVSLRLKVALSAGALATLVVLAFAAFSAWWFYQEQLDVESHERMMVPTAEQVAAAREETLELMVAYLVALPFAAILSGVGAWWLAGRLTTSLVRLTAAAKKIDAQSLDARLPEPRSGDEIFFLARTLNRLLDRLERSFQQSTRFAADASHELRTPLAVMRTQLEQAIKESPTGEQTPVFVELLEENHRLSSIADKLLLLARADAGQLLPGRSQTDFGQMVSDVADDYRIMASLRSVTVEGTGEGEVFVVGDPALLRQLVLNLFDNALKHNVVNGWIRFSLVKTAAMVRLSISNSGPPIPAAARQMLFERFFRLDESRNRGDGGGAGLGLSLCREIARAHGGSIVLVDSPSENEFLLELPMMDQPRAKRQSADSLRFSPAEPKHTDRSGG